MDWMNHPAYSTRFHPLWGAAPPANGPCQATRFLHIQFVIRGGRNRGCAALGEQAPAKKGLQVAVENLVDIAHFYLGAVVLGYPVGLQNIRPNLGTEVDIEF